MYGHHVHDAVIKEFKKWDAEEDFVFQSAVTMHFVDEKYDQGPIFFQLPVLIRPDETSESLAKRVNEKERAWQSKILNLVVHGHIQLKKNKVIYSCSQIELMCMGKIH